VILAVNKVESREDRETFFDFYQLGFSEVFEISAEQSLGLGDLLDAVVKDFERTEEEEEEETTYITIVGKPNVGKSTLSNQILGEERSIVSDIPGTTRDAIDSSFYRNGRKYTITDTAGLRKKSRIEKDTIERYSVIRSLAALRRADVVLFLVDAEQGVTDQDLKIAGYINDEGKPCVLLINKWDAIKKDTYTIESYKAHIANELPFLSYAPQIYISAKTGQRVQRIFEAIDICLENTNKKITTGLLNDTLRDALTSVEPPSKSGMRLKIFYGEDSVDGLHHLRLRVS
jgi:GTP-binding protein